MVVKTMCLACFQHSLDTFNVMDSIGLAQQCKTYSSKCHQYSVFGDGFGCHHSVIFDSGLIVEWKDPNSSGEHVPSLGSVFNDDFMNLSVLFLSVAFLSVTFFIFNVECH